MYGREAAGKARVPPKAGIDERSSGFPVDLLPPEIEHSIPIVVRMRPVVSADRDKLLPRPKQLERFRDVEVGHFDIAIDKKNQLSLRELDPFIAGIRDSPPLSIPDESIGLTGERIR